MKEIKELYAITQKLRDKYKEYNKQFTLDGKLVGDIGEVLAAEKYGLKLLPENTEIHDAFVIKDPNKKVQIKSSFKGHFLFPYDHVPNYYICSIIDEEGNLHEIYNGTGQYVKDNYIIANKLKGYKNSYYTLSKNILEGLNKKVPLNDKILKI